MSQQAEHSRLSTLDAMRGLGSIAVILWHMDFLGPFARSGYLAVDFFFILSGFVIAGAYQRKIEKGMTLPAFLTERIIRFYPLYLVGFLIGVFRLMGQIATHHPNAMTWPELGISAAFNLVMLPSPVTDTLAPINIPSWSLFCQLLVNMVWASMLVKSSTRTLIAYVVVLGVAQFVVIVVEGSARGGWVWSELHIGFIRSFFGFGFGVLLARLTAQVRARESLLAVLAVLALCGMFVVDISTTEYRVLYDIVAVFVLSPAIIWAAVAFDMPGALRSAAHALGEISYPVYMLHFAPLFIVSYTARKLDIPPVLWIPAFLVGICALSLYLARTYDPAARRFLKNLVAKRRAKVASAA